MNSNGFDMFQNSGYVNTRNRKKTLILDIDDTNDTHLGSGTEFSINLREPLIIDKHSEIYLDNFMTFNSDIADSPNHSAFCFRINEFNINSGIASSSSENNITGAVVIPNDNNNVDNYFSPVIHKAKKFNYLCDMNPCTLSRISGKITDLNGDPIFHGSSTGTKFTYALAGIETWGTPGVAPARALVKGDVLTSITAGSGGAGAVTGSSTRILADTVNGASTIYFTAEEELTPNLWDAEDLVFVVSGLSGYANYTFTISTSTNLGVVLLKQNARLISEFSIVSRE